MRDAKSTKTAKRDAILFSPFAFFVRCCNFFVLGTHWGVLEKMEGGDFLETIGTFCIAHLCKKGEVRGRGLEGEI